MEEEFILERIQTVANVVNAQNGTLAFGYQLSNLLEENNLSNSYLPVVRNNLKTPWPRSLALSEMIAVTIKNELRRTVKEKSITNDQDYMKAVLELFNIVLSDNDTFWFDEVKIKLKANFSTFLTDKEESRWYDLRKSHLGGFQLARALQLQTGVELSKEAELKLVQHGSCTLTSSDVKKLNFFVEPADDNSGDLATSVMYMQLMNILKGYSTKFPRDVFREKNKAAPGYTIEQKNQRSDFMFLFDINPTDGLPLIQFNINSCKLVRKGATSKKSN